MLINDWLVGETAALNITATDAAGVAIAPASIRLLIKPPGLPVHVIDSPAIIAPGSYCHQLVLGRPGNWYYRWEISGETPAAAEGSFFVAPSRFA